MSFTAVYIGLGSNLGSRRAHLARGLRALQSTDRLTGVSSVYESDPVGYVDQRRFLNLVVRLETTTGPLALLRRLQEIEGQARRERTIPQGPRTLDLDLLLYGREVIDAEGLQVPHPRMTERAFVLVPLLELDASLLDPRTGRPYNEHLAELAGLHRTMNGEELLHVGTD